MKEKGWNYFAGRYTGQVYFGLLLVNIIGGILQLPILQFITKPFLMPVLMHFIWLTVPNNRNRQIILLALFFSFAGDCFLLFETQWRSLFIPGLVCFLLTHILYIIYFLSKKIKILPGLKSMPLLTGLCILYGIIFLTVLFPSLGALKIPVTIYAIIIMSMLLAVFYVYTSLPAMAGKYFAIGALLFILSDSLLAFNKFLVPLGPFAIVIMITYGFAQWFIMGGFIKMRG